MCPISRTALRAATTPAVPTLTAVASATAVTSHDDRATRTEARRQGDSRTATVDHAGATGRQVTPPSSEPTDAEGGPDTQTVVRADDVR